MTAIAATMTLRSTLLPDTRAPAGSGGQGGTFPRAPLQRPPQVNEDTSTLGDVSRWLMWSVAALGVHALVLMAFLLLPKSESITPPQPFAVAIIAPPQPQHIETPKPLPTPPQPKVHSKPSPAPVPLAKEPSPTALTTQAPPPAPVAEAAPAKAAPVEAPAPAPIVQPRFDAAYLNNPPPNYPTLSRRMNEQGKVFLRVHVQPSGLPDQVELKTSSGFPRLDNSAIEAVKHWRFVPAKQGNDAVAAWVVVPVAFNLEN